MDSNKPKLIKEIFPLLKIYEDGTVERFMGTETIPPSLNDPKVQSKDVIYSPQNNLTSRIYLPKSINSSQKKLPLLIYIHGGGFCIESAFSPTYHNYLKTLVSEANIIVVSINYRLAPEYPIPIAYDDSWETLKWVSSHINGGGSEEWLSLYADFNKVFLAGDSAGANIAHYLAMKNGQESLIDLNILGIVLIHPYFWGEENIGNETKNQQMKSMIESLWSLTHPLVKNFDDPLINPACDPNLSKLGCKRVLVIVAEKDILKDRGWYYYEALKRSEWEGLAEIMEAKEEEHVFHLMRPTCENAIDMLKRISSFLNQEN